MRPESAALAKIATTASASTLIEQTYTSTDYEQPTSLEVRATYSGEDADSMRAWVASRSVADVAKELDKVNNGKWTFQSMIFESASRTLHLSYGPGPVTGKPYTKLELGALLEKGFSN